MDNTEKISVEFGALVDPLSKQLKGLLPHRRLVGLQESADAITRLRLNGLLTEGETRRARQKLVNVLAREARRRP